VITVVFKPERLQPVPSPRPSSTLALTRFTSARACLNKGYISVFVSLASTNIFFVETRVFIAHIFCLLH
jgi:hypothetical protein